MSKQEIQISGVKLINGGLKGLEIKYLRINDLNSNRYKAEISEKSRRPVNIEMQLKFEEFKSYLAELCSVEEEKVSITGIVAGHSKFLISGTIEVLGKKKSAINTPAITEEDKYDKWDEVQAKVDEIYKMVLSYMEDNSYTATSEQMILQFNKGKEGFDESSLKNMSQEEMVAEATKLLEKIGCVVMNPHEEDMPGGIDSQEEILPLKDISAGDEKQGMFVDCVIIDSEEQISKNEDLDKLKQKSAEKLAKLKESQDKLENIVDEEDEFIPMRRVI